METATWSIQIKREAGASGYIEGTTFRGTYDEAVRKGNEMLNRESIKRNYPKAVVDIRRH